MRALSAAAAAAALNALPASLLAQEEMGLFDINTGLSLWALIVFLILLLLLAKFAWGPILNALETRERNIQSSIDDATRLRKEASDALDEHRLQLREARHEAQHIIAEAKEAAAGLGRELEAKARQESAAIVQRARREIEVERDAVLEAIRKETVGLALAAASRLVRQRLDAPEDRELVNNYLSSLSAIGKRRDA
ncbi:MAG: F0F1 ATP synthase subunit B [Gammaproteobacteria bacterium]|nr:F0F1 ATP synthase subunit B [Gammaproteobacteria bacterium]MDE0259337.1 F0F1 ATP synthase subunit B [Gammaproteobacteria bacterium]